MLQDENNIPLVDDSVFYYVRLLFRMEHFGVLTGKIAFAPATPRRADVFPAPCIAIGKGDSICPAGPATPDASPVRAACPCA